jgi:hypothetical protein
MAIAKRKSGGEEGVKKGYVAGSKRQNTIIALS